MTIIHDPFINKIRDHIRFTAIEYPEGWERLLKSFSIPLAEGQAIHRTIDWSRISEKYETCYGLIDNESQITEGLLKSPLNTCREVLMDFGFQYPVIVIPIKVFIDNWLSFIKITTFTGTVVITEDGSLFMEFTDDADFLLISNFLIVSNS